MNFREYSKLERVGFIGLAICSFISILLYVIDISPAYSGPFFLPWIVFILIGRDKRRNGRKPSK